ncbi:MAG: 6-phosphogluconolactonase [Candidatus Dormiibacterota bacterium]
MLVKLRDAEAVARAVASAVTETAFKAIHEHGGCALVLAGGNTPRRAYQILAGELRDEVDWRRVSFYFGDERCVPPDDPRSNYRMARETLFDPLKLGQGNVFRIAGELSPEAGAADYDAQLRHLKGERSPMFDLVLLGMGAEGHTASLFPGSPALEERARLAAAAKVPAEPPDRVTLTLPALSESHQILFVVTGAEKADALARVFSDGSDLPAAQVAALAPSRFLADEAAASEVPA